MRYEKYEERIKKIRKIRNGIFHLRFVLIGTAIAGVVAGSAVMACTGMINEAGKLNSTYEYGEPINVKGNAFLSDVVYEYKSKSSDDWSVNRPVNAGKYEYRYYTTNTFGQKKYSEPVDFEIAKKKIEIPITSNSVTYGEDPSYDTPYLIGEDKIKSLSFGYDSFEQMTTKAFVKDVVITNKTGADVTNNYEISTPKKDILFDKRFLDVMFKGGEKVFDNTSIVNNEDGVYDKNDLAFNDHIEFGPSQSLITVGKIKNLRDLKILNDEGTDVTHLYTVRRSAEDLVVNPRTIKIHSKNVTRVYNGQDAKQEWEYEDGSLTVIPGHELKVEFDNFDSWRVGVRRSTFTATVVDEVTKEPVNQNLYNIVPYYGTINVTPRPIQIVTNTVEKYYDGTAIYDSTFQASGLADGDTIIANVSNVPTLNYIGSIKNEIPYKIMRGGEDVTNYYTTKPYYGDLTLKARPLTCALHFETSKVYDGKPWSFGDTFYEILGPDQDPMSQGLAPGHIEVVDFPYDNNIVDVGNYTIDDFKLKIYEQNEFGQPNLNREVTDYYNITYPGKTNKINITPRPISIETPSIQKTYDGQPVTTGMPKVTKGSLINGHQFLVQDKNDLIDVTDEKGVPNQFDIIIVDKLTNENKTKNYKFVDTKYGTINIDQTAIEVSPKNVTKVYDDRPYNASQQELNVKFLDPVYQNTLTHYNVKAYGYVKSSQIDVTNGQSAVLKIDSTFPIVVKLNDKDVSKNFAVLISNQNADLDIDPIPVEIGVNDRSIVFDENVNESLSVNDCYMKGAIPGHRLTNVTFSGEITEPGQTSIISINEYDIYSPKRKLMVTNNYFLDAIYSGNMTSSYGQTIEIISPDVERTYDGTKVVLQPQEKVIKHTDLPNPNHKLVIDNWELDNENIVNVSESWGYRNSFRFHIENENGKDVTNVYSSFSIRPGALSIHPRKVEYKYRNVQKIYDGQEHKYELEPDKITDKGYEIVRNPRNKIYLANKDGLLSGHRLFLTNFNNAHKEVGAYNPLEFATFTVYDSNNQIVDSSNYDIIPKNGSYGFSIVNRDIKFTTYSFNGTIDDYRLFFESTNTLYYDSNQLVSGHRLEFTMPDFGAQYDEWGFVVDTNKPVNDIRIYDEYGNDVTYCYNIIADYGQINIIS